MSLLNLTLEALWFFLPAAMANMAPIFAHRFHWLESLRYPLDGYATIEGKRLLGDNKTIRGFISGAAAGAVTGICQYLAYTSDTIQAISVFPYTSPTAALSLGLLLGSGALLGDTLKSFFKRRLNIPSGHPWIPFDQMDFVLGATLLTWWLGVLTVSHVMIGVIMFGLASYVVSVIGVTVNIKKSL